MVYKAALQELLFPGPQVGPVKGADEALLSGGYEGQP